MKNYQRADCASCLGVWYNTLELLFPLHVQQFDVISFNAATPKRSWCNFTLTTNELIKIIYGRIEVSNITPFVQFNQKYFDGIVKESKLFMYIYIYIYM